MAHHDPLTLVQELYGCFARGDVPALLDRLSPDCEWRFIGDRKMPYTGSAHGRQAIAQWFGHVASNDELLVFEPRQLLAGADHVTVIGFERTRDRATGREFQCEWVHVWRFSAGRVSSFWGMLDSEAAAATRA